MSGVHINWIHPNQKAYIANQRNYNMETAWARLKDDFPVLSILAITTNHKRSLCIVPCFSVMSFHTPWNTARVRKTLRIVHKIHPTCERMWMIKKGSVVPRCINVYSHVACWNFWQHMTSSERIQRELLAVCFPILLYTLGSFREFRFPKIKSLHWSSMIKQHYRHYIVPNACLAFGGFGWPCCQCSFCLEGFRNTFLCPSQLWLFANAFLAHA